MKKLLLVSTAIAGVAMMSSPASAALKTDLGGFFDGYGMYADNNLPVGTDQKSDISFLRDSEVFFNGESTLDNGLTIGAHTQLYVGDQTSTATPTTLFTTAGAAAGKTALIGQTSNSFEQGSLVDEGYAYASGGWGRVNFGEEDGAAYLLQVAAPSADSNVDGLRTYFQGLNTGMWNANLAGLVLNYQQADFRQTERLTYLTPKFNGFQAGLSYAPLPDNGVAIGSSVAAPGTYSTATLTTDFYKDPWEAAARWDGEFSGVAASLGAGYSSASNKSESTPVAAGAVGSADLNTYNFGGNVATSGFSLGAAYKHTNNGISAAAGSSDDTRIWDVGGGYDNGPYHAGLSYFNERFDGGLLFNPAAGDSTVHRYAAGGGYTFGPGMTFRGSVDWGKYDADASSAADVSTRFTQVTVGTDIQF